MNSFFAELKLTAKEIIQDSWRLAIAEMTGQKIPKQKEEARMEIPRKCFDKHGIPFGKLGRQKVYFPPKGKRVDNHHKIIVGATGLGKTTLATRYSVDRPGGLAFLMNDDGSAALKLLQALPEERLEKTVVLDHSRQQFPLPIGTFARSDHNRFEREMIANQWLRFFETNFDVDRMYMTSELIVMACRVVFSIPHTTFYDVILMIRYPQYRYHLLDKLDPRKYRDLLLWWEQYEQKRPEEQRRISGAFFYRADNLFRESTMIHTLGYPAKNLDYRKWIDEGYTVIVIAPENLGNHIVRIIMAIHALSFWQAALLRARSTPEHRRTPFVLIADEPQTWLFNNAGVIDDMFSKGRKYGFGVMSLFQSFEQIHDESPKLLKVIRDNQPDLLVFRTSNERSPFKKINMEELPDYHFVCKLGSYSPFQASSLGPPKPLRSERWAQEFIRQQRLRFNVRYEEIETDIERRLNLWADDDQSILDQSIKSRQSGYTKTHLQPKNKRSSNSSTLII